MNNIHPISSAAPLSFVQPSSGFPTSPVFASDLLSPSSLSTLPVLSGFHSRFGCCCCCFRLGSESCLVRASGPASAPYAGVVRSGCSGLRPRLRVWSCPGGGGVWCFWVDSGSCWGVSWLVSGRCGWVVRGGCSGLRSRPPVYPLGTWSGGVGDGVGWGSVTGTCCCGCCWVCCRGSWWGSRCRLWVRGLVGALGPG